jgi:hypothetical protein
MRILDPTASTDALSALVALNSDVPIRAVPIVSTRLRPSTVRLVCTPCGERYSGTSKTPRLCPFCGSDDVLPEAS